MSGETVSVPCPFVTNEDGDECGLPINCDIYYEPPDGDGWNTPRTTAYWYLDGDPQPCGEKHDLDLEQLASVIAMLEGEATRYERDTSDDFNDDRDDY